MPKAVLAVSLSAVSAYRTCQQLYYYRHVERIRRRDKAAAPELGIILHDYLALYYQGLQVKHNAQVAHGEARQAIIAKYRPETTRMASLVRQAGDDEGAKRLYDIPDKAARIADRYFAARGIQDADEQEILLVEEYLTLPMFRGRAVSNGRLDMITRSRSDGMTYLWEHKSTTDIPDSGYRMRDLQTPLYRRKIERLKIAPAIDSVMWNYLKTKEPTPPRHLKNGTLTKDKHLDSTWEVYSAEIKRLKLDPTDYLDVRRRLEGRETSIFFPRFNQPILSDTDVLYRDFLQSVKDIAKSRRDWAEGVSEPVRNLGLSCNWCEMAMLCNAAILTGDDSDVKHMRYTVGS